MKVCLSCEHRFESPSWRCPNCSWQPLEIDGRPAFAPDLANGNEGFSPLFFSRLAALEAGHFWFESRNRLLVWALRKYFPNALRVLEIGCGTGFVLAELQRQFPHTHFLGSEIYPEGLQLAASRLPETDLFQMNARQVPFAEEFDVVGAFDVLEHIEEDEEVLAQMYRAVRPGGGILLTVPQHPALWSAVDDYSYHKRRYVRSELVRKAVSAGFGRVRAISFISILLPLLAVSRLRNRRYTDSFDPVAELRISPIINRILTGMLSLERRFIQAGASLPAGGSLLLIGYRDKAR